MKDGGMFVGMVLAVIVGTLVAGAVTSRSKMVRQILTGVKEG